MKQVLDSIELIQTEDGSTSLRRNDLEETYHSTFGAVDESKHIYIDAGLDHYSKQIQPKQNMLNILEIGFGTGLNAILANDYACLHNKKIYYKTLEKYPLQKEIYSQLNYSDFVLDKECFDLVHSCSWQEKTEINPFFLFEKIASKAEDYNYDEDFFDIIFFDAFAPQYETELWTLPMAEKMFACLKPSGVLTTYCCKGEVKRTLKSAGFLIKKLPGPKGKREILRATKP